MKSKRIAYSGMLLALNAILFVMLNIFQSNTLFIMGLASCIVSIIIIEWDVKTGILYYIASVILGFIIITNKIHWIVYVFTFGVYGIAKYYIEQDRPILLEYILKIIYANIALGVTYFIVQNFVYVPAHIYLVLIFEIAFLIYDYAYSYFIEYYEKKLSKFIK